MSGNAHIAWVSCFNVSHICTWGREVIGLPCIVRVVISSTYVNTGVIMAASTVYIAPGWCLSAQQPQMLYKCYSHDCFSSVYCMTLTIVRDSIFWTCCTKNGLFMPPFGRSIETSIWDIYMTFNLQVACLQANCNPIFTSFIGAHMVPGCCYTIATFWRSIFLEDE